MRNKRLLPMLLLWLLVAAPLGVWAQYPSFTLAGLVPMRSGAIVRTYSASQVAAYYSRGDNSYLALVDAGGLVKQTQVDSRYTVCDMRIVGDELFFCGKKGTAGFVGHLSLSALESGTPTVTYYDLPINGFLHQMAAYKIGGMVKVVALGVEYNNNPFCPCPIVGASTCAEHQLVEADFVGGSFTNVQSLQTTLLGWPVDELFDLVETDRYLAVIAVDRPSYNLAIHVCDKPNVIATFGNYHTYTMPPAEAHNGYIGCLLEGDKIAVASVATMSAPAHDYRTQLMTFDLQTHQMLSAQEFGMLDKTLPDEMVYYPGSSTLVLLEGQKLVDYDWQTTFVHLRPFDPAPYTADTYFVTSIPNDFSSMDKAADSYYVATGGSYWMLKSLSAATGASACYKQIRQSVTDIGLSPDVARSRPCYPSPLTPSTVTSSNYSTANFNIYCQ